MHIPQFENNNEPIVNCNSKIVPLCYFNIIKLSAGEEFSYQLSDYETCIVPATGTIDVEVEGQAFCLVGDAHHDVEPLQERTHFADDRRHVFDERPSV